MKKILFGLALITFIASCGNSENNEANTDLRNEEAPAAIEDTSTVHSGGIINQNVISTDTAAMNNGFPPADSSNR